MDTDGEAVLHFLLGKTRAMPLEDTRSATSTTSSQDSDATSAASSSSAFKDEDEPGAKAVEDPVGADTDGDGHLLELRPICEDESEQEEEHEVEDKDGEEEEEEEEEVGTDHESTDGEQEEAETSALDEEKQCEEEATRGDDDEKEAAATDDDKEEAPATGNDDDKHDVQAETTAGTESEVEDEDGCGRMDERGVVSTARDSSLASSNPLQSEASDDEDEDAIIKCSDTRAASPPSAGTEHEATRATEPAAPEKASGVPSLGELALMSVVAVALFAYVVACAYSFLSRDMSGAVVLPDASRFEHPIDMPSVSVRIVSPANHSAISASLLRLDWQLENFPADALRAGGPEVYHYDVLVNDQRLTSDVALLELTPSEKEDERVTALNRSMTEYIHWEKLDTSAEVYTVRIDVQVSTPGAFDQVTTLSQSLVLVNSQKAAGEVDTGAIVIKTPEDGARVQPDEDVVLTYVAGTSVTRLRVVVDGAFVAWKTHVDDGVLLLHGLAEGAHVITLEAVGEMDGDVESSASVRVHIGSS